jgi:hypothetical protein
MSWTFRAFMVAYAAAWIVLAVAQGFATQVFARDSSFNDRWVFWMTIGTTAVSYAVLAFGYLTCRVKAKAPAWPWLAGVFALVLSPLVGFDWRTAFGSAPQSLAYKSLRIILSNFRSELTIFDPSPPAEQYRTSGAQFPLVEAHSITWKGDGRR